MLVGFLLVAVLLDSGMCLMLAFGLWLAGIPTMDPLNVLLPCGAMVSGEWTCGTAADVATFPSSSPEIVSPFW